MAKPIVRIDALPESALRHSGCDAIVCIDVLLSATSLVTAVAQGRRVFAASSASHAHEMKSMVGDAVVVTDGAPDDGLPYAGPATLAGDDDARSLVHVSPLAAMLQSAAPPAKVYVACLRNLKATAIEIAHKHWKVAILAAGHAGEVCSEDQMAAAWLAARLRRRGFSLEGRRTVEEVARWGRPDVSLVGWSRSAERLRSHGRGSDVDFVLGHVDDLNCVCAYASGELRPVRRNAPATRGTSRVWIDTRPRPVAH